MPNELELLAANAADLRRVIHYITHDRMDDAVALLADGGNLRHQGMVHIFHYLSSLVFADHNNAQLAAAHLERAVVRTKEFLEVLQLLLIRHQTRYDYDSAYGGACELLKNDTIQFGIREQLEDLRDTFHTKITEHARTLEESSRKWYGQHIRYLFDQGITLKGKKVLEIGGSIIPYNSLVYYFLGAETVAIDKFRSPDSSHIIGIEAQLICYKYLFEALYDNVIGADIGDQPRKNMSDAISRDGKSVIFVDPMLSFRYGIDSGDMDFENDSFDFIFSHTTLEHVGDPDGDPADTAREIARVLRPGGYSIHRIAVNDHRSEDNTMPYEQFKYSEREWRSMPVIQSQRTNRWTMSRWRTAFTSCGLDEVFIDLNDPSNADFPPITSEIISSFHPDFSCLDPIDFEKLYFVIVNRKPGDV